jgi:hypothetical protein
MSGMYSNPALSGSAVHDPNITVVAAAIAKTPNILNFIFISLV